MKKIVVFIFLLIFSFSAFAIDVGNQQKIYPIDSPVYEALVQLYISAGIALPSTTGPYSANELALMLSRLDRNSLKEPAKVVYDYVNDTLSAKPKVVRFGLDTTIEGYVHTNTEDFTQPDDWIYSTNDRKPFLDIILETSPKNNFYGYTSFPIMSTYAEDGDNTNGKLITDKYGSTTFMSNIFLIHPTTSGDPGFGLLDLGFPYRAFGAFGGDGWSVQVGREQLSWGPGKSGNFVIGDHLHYHNVGRFTTYTKNFKYTLLTSFFPHPSEYYKVTKYGYGGYVNLDAGQTDVSSGLNMFLGHRLEWRFLKDKVNLVLTETIMYQSKDNTFDLRVLSPAAVFHNYYIRSNANSILSLEVDVTPIKYLNIYAQVVVDEFVLPGEPALGEDGSLPDGLGYMVGVQGNYPLLSGFIFGSFEWAMTDPYLYLRDNGNYKQELGQYGINYVVAVREYMTRGIHYKEDFLGYKYGGDAIVFNGQVGYSDYKRWNATLNVFYMIHGVKDKWSLWAAEDLTNGTSLETTPTTDHANMGNNRDEHADGRDSVENTLVVGINGSYKIIKGLSVFGQADLIYIVNPGNKESNPSQLDFQLTVGATYSL